MVETVARGHFTARAGVAVVVLADVSVREPRIHEKRDGFLAEVAARLRQVVVPQRQIGEEVHGRPDAPAPVVHLGIGGIVARDGRHDPFTPELIGVVEVIAHATFGLFLRGGAGEEGVEVRRRNARIELAGVGAAVQEETGRLVPQVLQGFAVRVGAVAQFLGFIGLAQLGRDVGQAIAVADVEAVEAHVG